MTKVGIRALQQNASAVVAQVIREGSVTITVRGRPVARMVPAGANHIDTLIKSGQARPPTRRLRDLPKPLQSQKSEKALSDELEEMRRAERY